MQSFTKYLIPISNSFSYIYICVIATFTNPEGLVITYTNELPETILLQLGSSNNYYTSGEHGISFIKTGFNKILVLEHTYCVNGNIFQNYTTN